MQKCLNITIWCNQTELCFTPHANRLLRWGSQDLGEYEKSGELEIALLEELLFLVEQIEPLCQAFPEIEAVRLRVGNEPIRAIEQLLKKHFHGYSFPGKVWL